MLHCGWGRRVWRFSACKDLWVFVHLRVVCFNAGGDFFGGFWSLFRSMVWGSPGLGPRACIVGPGGGLWAVSKVERTARTRTPRFPRFILLASFSDTLLMVSIIEIVYDCYLRPLLQS